MGTTDDRQLQEAIARCVSIMVFYHNTERSPDSADRMAEEIRSEARVVAGMADEAYQLVFRAIEVELMARFGPELGPRFVSEFMSLCDPGSVEAKPLTLERASGMNIGCRPGEAKPGRAALARRLGIIRAERFGGERGLDQLASLLGLPTRTWRNYESGVSIPGEVLLKFIEITSAEPLWLLRGVGPRCRRQQSVRPLNWTSTDLGVESEINPEGWVGQCR